MRPSKSSPDRVRDGALDREIGSAEHHVADGIEPHLVVALEVDVGRVDLEHHSSEHSAAEPARKRLEVEPLAQPAPGRRTFENVRDPDDRGLLRRGHSLDELQTTERAAEVRLPTCDGSDARREESGGGPIDRLAT